MNDNDAKGRFVSECIDVFIDEPGDHTVRPIRPERLEQMKALRDQILADEAEAAQESRIKATP
jgi:hypothetical protein